jgi:hypothetical protein
MVFACGEATMDGMSTFTTLLSNEPRHIVDDVAIRVLRRRATASSLILEIEVDLPTSLQARQSARSVTGSGARPPSSQPRVDERRKFVSLALAVLAGFAFTATFASALAILL